MRFNESYLVGKYIARMTLKKVYRPGRVRIRVGVQTTLTPW